MTRHEPAENATPALRTTLAILRKRRGNRQWDFVIRAAGLGALVGIPISSVFPDAVPLVWLALIAVPVNGPYSPVLPTSFEPIVMEVAKYQAPVAVALVATLVVVYSEYVDWQIYDWVLGWRRFVALRDRRWLARSVGAFGRFPFLTVVVFALTPLPFWVARCLSILHGYSLRRHLAATATGRFPRYWLYAWAGATLQIPTVALALFFLGSAAVGIGLYLLRRDPLRTAPAAAPSSGGSPDTSSTSRSESSR